MKNYDLICIGGGSGGIAGARRAAEYGAKVAVIEKDKLGGTCVNRGCVPKKLFYYAAEHLEIMHSCQNYGFSSSGKFAWQEFKDARDAFIAKLNSIYENNLAKAEIDFFHGKARFVGEKQVQVGEEIITAPHIIIATGGQPYIPTNIEGYELAISSDEFFNLEQQPEKIVIVGGGYIACEIAGILRSLGSEVDLVVRGKRILKHIDAEIIANQEANMMHSGINLLLNEEVQSIKKDGENLAVKYKSGKTTSANQVLFATGRKTNILDLNLEATGVNFDPTTQLIPVDKYQNTNVEGIYALGDVIGKADLTPVAIAAARKLAARIFKQEDAYLDYNNIPTVIFTHPPIANVGLNQEEAEKIYGKDKIRVYKTAFQPMSRHFSLHKAKFAIKLVCLGEEEKIIGLCINGDGADEMLQGFAVAIKMGACKKDFDNCVAIHPTAAEEAVTLR